MKVCQVIKTLKNSGWRLERTTGSHRQFKHPIMPQLVTLPGKLSKDIPIGTLHKIKKIADLRIK